MVGNMTKEELKGKNIEIKDEIQGEILPTSTVEDTYTVYIKEEDVKVEIREPKHGKILKYNLNINIKFHCIENFR